MKVVAGTDEKEDRETILNLKNDFVIDYTKTENVFDKLKEIQEERMKGKKKILHHVKLLTYMLEQSKDTRHRIEILLSLVSSIFASAKTATSSGYLSREAWIGALNHINTLIKHLEEPVQKNAPLTLQHKKSTMTNTEDG